MNNEVLYFLKSIVLGRLNKAQHGRVDVVLRASTKLYLIELKLN